ncbi:MAG: hypothetical protein KC501_05450 [Myxococcales bacterium]|nr:hypothetical protein [Myxococcales bacterium]
MARLIPCPECRSHVLTAERQCPHCGASLPASPIRGVPAVLVGLTLAGCPVADDVGEPEYGVPATTSGPADSGSGAADSGSGSESSGGATSGGSTSEGSGGSDGSTDSGSSVGEPDYGVPTTSG